ncbi:MAG: metallophosphoesterase [Polyangia bacterium]
MRLKFLAISDTHLGEDTSLLGFPQALQHLWEVLRKQLGGSLDAPVEVDELVLVGDIADRTLSSTSQIITATNAFMQTMLSALQIKKLVYVPGNHDHTLWTRYAERRPHLGAGSTTPPAGELIVDVSQPLGEIDRAFRPLLGLFFGWPYGSAWNRIVEQKALRFIVANPLYAASLFGRTYAFLHGTHFRKDVLWSKKTKKLAAEALRLVGLKVATGEEPELATSLEDLERRVTPFVDSLWPSSLDRPTSRSDQLWYLLNVLGGRFDRHRPVPDTRLYSLSELQSEPPPRAIHKLAPLAGEPDSSVQRLNRLVLGHLLRFLEQHGLPSQQVTMVYGDTHHGGFGELTTGASQVRLFNTGAWVMDGGEDSSPSRGPNHPATHLFAVDDGGREYLLDVSFAGVQSDEYGPTLLDLASRDYENRQRASSQVTRWVMARVPHEGGRA